MKPFNLRDYVFNDRPAEEPGQRAEAIVTLAFGFIFSVLSFFSFRDSRVLLSGAIASLVALFMLVQAVRGRYAYLILFPAAAAVTVYLAAVLDGKGTHDLIWTGHLALFMLAVMYSRKNFQLPIWLGVLMVGSFIATGISEINGSLPNRYGTTPQYILFNSLFFIAAMSIMVVVFQRQRTLLNSAVENRNEQIKASRRLEEANRTLEEQSRTRGLDLNRANDQLQVKTMRLQAASEISQEISANLNLPPYDLLAHVAQGISEKFGYYHVGIFILDENREYAVLRASNSKGGQQMLARRHQLRVGGAGIVGYVSQSGRPRIALDTGADAVFFNNPDLPETRSEIALPLKYGTQVIGVLDVQSTKSSAFNVEDSNILSALASQLATMYNNLQLTDTEQGIGAFRIVNRRPGLQMSRGKVLNGYMAAADGSISNVTLQRNPAVDKAIASGETFALSAVSKGSSPVLAVPVKLRDQVIGVIHIEATHPNRKWTEDEVAMVQAISERAALALENARLFENATHRAQQEETIARITTQIGSSTDFSRILQTTIQELGQALGASRSFIQLTPPAENGNKTDIE